MHVTILEEKMIILTFSWRRCERKFRVVIFSESVSSCSLFLCILFCVQMFEMVRGAGYVHFSLSWLRKNFYLGPVVGITLYILDYLVVRLFWKSQGYRGLEYFNSGLYTYTFPIMEFGTVRWLRKCNIVYASPTIVVFVYCEERVTVNPRG